MPSAGLATVVRRAISRRPSAEDAGPDRMTYVPAAVKLFVTPAAARRYTDSDDTPATPNEPAWIDVPGDTHSADTPPTSGAPSVKELTACAMPFVRTSRPVPSSVRSVPDGNAAVAAISQMPFDVMRVGPAQCCGRKKRNPEL